jgi:16S rRNA (cytidine1402-2'-O)-methyltransferase
MAAKGVLYIVATPIGNLSDITYRAVETLRSAGLIACEDTRQTRKLLDHYGVKVRVTSYHEHNEAARTGDILQALEQGLDVALVSDAGTPLISDPGFRVVQAAAQAGIQVVPIPGPSAALAALSASGLPTDSFRFCGFMPRKSGERRRLLESLRGAEETIVLYEAPHRIVETLRDVEEVLGDPPVVVARELTKIHEEMLRAPASKARAALEKRDTVKGEITLLIGKSAHAPASDEPLEDAVRRQEEAGLTRMEAIKAAARERGLPKREVYKLLERG